METKIIAFYLPQFHEIPENNKWWGNGFTEWTNMKKAVSLFDNHYQPRIPLNNNYYDLSNVESIEWQAKIAKKYGIYGFCFYHYWFDGKLLLEKPMELLLQNKHIDINYCVSWANEDWTNAWVSGNSKTLISQTYGGIEQWDKHYEYLKQFFEDSRYICIGNKPVLVIYRPNLIPNLNDMLDRWNELAQKDGFAGIHLMYQHPSFAFAKDKDDTRFQNCIEYQPGYSRLILEKEQISKLLVLKRKIDFLLQKYCHIKLDLSWMKKNNGPERFDYDAVWENILNIEAADGHIPGAFVDWDNTPRRNRRGSVAVGAKPEKFEKYMRQLIKKAHDEYKTDMIFIFAWNEWAEGGYLEPDERNGVAYLEAISRALIDVE